MSAPDDVSLIQVLFTIGRRWRLVLTAGFVGLLLAGTIAFLTTPIYRAETLLSFNGDELVSPGLASLASQFGGLSSLAGLAGGSEGRKDVALALLSSRGFVETFIEEKRLLPVLFADRWNDADGSWSTSGWSEPPTVADGVEKMVEQVVNVSEDRRTGLVRVSIEWSDRDLAAEWANELVRRVNDVTRALAIAEAKESTQYLEAELAKTSVVEMRQSIYRLIQAELEKEMVASVRVQYSFRVIDAAKAPDPDDFVRPQRFLLTLFGLFMGVALGVIGVLVLSVLRPSR
jgi:uncharacterized protein involved in exopolysaccharide biosynthesis